MQGTETAQEGAVDTSGAQGEGAEAESTTSENESFTLNADGSINLDGGDESAEGEQDAEGGEQGQQKAGQEDLSAAEQAARTAKAAARMSKQKRAREKQQERELQQLRSERQRAQQEEQLLRTDPVAYLRQKGFSDREIAEHMARHAGPEDAIEVLKQQNRALQERIDNWERQQLTQQQTKQVQEIRSKFIEVSSDEARFPHLAVQPEEVVHSFLRKAVAHVDSQGEDANDYEYDELVTIAEKIYVNSLRRKPAAQQSADQDKGGAQQANGNGRKASRPLTNDKVSRRFVKPANFDSLPLDEQEKILDKIYSAENLMSVDGEP